MSGSTKLKSFFRLLKEALRGDQQDYTALSIDKAILLLSVPMVVEMAMESVFAVVDAFFVGQLHDNSAVATIGLTESMLTLVYSVAMGLSMAGTAMVARRVGEKDFESAKVAATQIIVLGIFVSLVVSVVGIFYSEDLLRLMGGSESLIEHNSGFTRWMLTGNISIVMLFLINGIFRGAGNASIAMRSLILANTVNMVLDPIFIFGWGPIPAFGVEGAGIATTTGRTIGVIYQVYHLAKGSGLIKVYLQDITIKWDIIKRLVILAAGGTGQMLIGSGSWIFLNRIIASFGESALAGYTFAIRVIVFAILPAWGMANAAATLVGQNLGAGFPDRAEKSVWRAGFFNMIFLGFVTIIFYLLARPILGLFSTDPVTIQHGVECLQIVSLGYVFYAYSMVVNQSFNGAGDTRTPTIISFVGFWLFQIPFAYILANTLQVGTIGVYAAISIAESLMAIVGIFIFRRGKWKLTQV